MPLATNFTFGTQCRYKSLCRMPIATSSSSMKFIGSMARSYERGLPSTESQSCLNNSYAVATRNALRESLV